MVYDKSKIKSNNNSNNIDGGNNVLEVDTTIKKKKKIETNQLHNTKNKFVEN